MNRDEDPLSNGDKVPLYSVPSEFQRITEVSYHGGFVPIFWRFRPHLYKFTIGYVIQPFSWIFRVILARNKLKITRELHTRKKKQTRKTNYTEKHYKT